MNDKLQALALALVLVVPPVQAADQAANATPVTATLDADGVQRATVTVDSYSFSPSHLIVTAGKPVELTLVSITSFVPHDLVIDDPAAGFAAHQDVGAGETVKLNFTAPNAGSFAFYCDKNPPLMKSHRAKGMEGVLEVR